MTAPTHWWWVRHAPVPGAAGRLFGQLDVSCDTSDGEAFRALAAVLPGDAVWIVSALARTRETMAAIAAARPAAETPLPEPSVEADFNEQSFGRWQGLGWHEMEAADPAAYAAFWRNPVRTAPPGGESYAAHVERVAAAIARQMTEHAGRTIVSVSHGGTIRAACAVALGLSPETAMALAVDNLSVTRLSHVEDGLLRGRGGVWRVDGINCTRQPPSDLK